MHTTQTENSRNPAHAPRNRRGDDLRGVDDPGLRGLDTGEVFAVHDAIRAGVQPPSALRLSLVNIPDALHLEALAFLVAIMARHRAGFRACAVRLSGALATPRIPRRRGAHPRRWYWPHVGR